MTDKRQPWMKWYPADWRADPCLRMCSFAARGLWADMLSLMHEAEPYGHLLINGIVPNAKQLASLLGGSEREVKGLLSELQAAGVFSLNDDDVVFSRRMVRDKAKAEFDRENGKRGGNPRLLSEGNPSIETPGLTPGDKAQRLDARDQKLGSGSSNPRSPRGARESAADLGFDRWYPIYPKHEARGSAEAAFVKARKIASLEELIAGAERYGATVDRRENGRFIALPATWLNQKRWLDGPPADGGIAPGTAIPQRRKPQSPAPIFDGPQGLDGELH